MDPVVMLERLNNLYAAWQQRKPMTNMPRKARHQSNTFSFYVLRRDPELYEAVSIDVSLLAECSSQLRKDWHGIRSRPIGMETLKKYMGEITDKYLTLEQRIALDQFLTQILEECTTELELKVFLRK